MVSFTDSSTGDITGWAWDCDSDGVIDHTTRNPSHTYAAPGFYTVKLTASGPGGTDTEVKTNLINASAPETVIDNGAPGTSYTGTWNISGAPYPYGADSLWSRDGSTYTWTFVPEITGFYQVSIWWTWSASRSTNVPADITYSGGTDRLYLNQHEGGGWWHNLGVYFYEEGSQYNMKITSPPYPESTCADAVKCRFIGPSYNSPPLASDDSAVADLNSPVQINVLENDEDSDGTIISTSIIIIDEPAHGFVDISDSGILTYTPDAGYIGTDVFSYRVEDNGHVESNRSYVHVTVGGYEEHIYYCPLYNGGGEKPLFLSTLADIGFRQEDTDLWRYTSPASGKVYWVHITEDIESMKTALSTEGTHMIIAGHSNYGSGGLFATQEECNEQEVSNLHYIDDDRIFNYSSPVYPISFRSCRRSHAWPNFWCIFKDGEYGLMPYDFDDPASDPAYNYYLTYQIPGDSTRYKIETAANSALERYPDADQPPWYSPNGLPPDPDDPDERQYFITNPGAWIPPFEVIGNWIQDNQLSGCYSENYTSIQAGYGANEFIWKFQITQPGNYLVEAWWPASTSNTRNAPYTINHASGSTVVRKDQRSSGGRWNSLGQFYFGAGEYTVVLTDGADPGRVVADAVRITDAIANYSYTKTMDNISYPKYHYGSKTIFYIRELEIPKNELRYSRMIYDSCTSGNYYLDTFGHGIVFYTVQGASGQGINYYIRAYIEGKSDYEIWQTLQNFDPIYDYYDFSKTPSGQ